MHENTSHYFGSAEPCAAIIQILISSISSVDQFGPISADGLSGATITNSSCLALSNFWSLPRACTTAQLSKQGLLRVPIHL